MSGEARYLPWVRMGSPSAPTIASAGVWVPVADALAILDDHGADLLREALIAVLDQAAPLARGGDD